MTRSPELHEGSRIPISHELIVGRETAADIPLEADGYASARHCRFVRGQAVDVIEDLHSTNGTFVNGAASKRDPQLAGGRHHHHRPDPVHLRARRMRRAVADRAGATQTGNVRRLNEDSYLIREPLFMVADGMGGAQAGEIASRMATEEFAQARLKPPRGEATLRDMIVTANGSIIDHARSDSTAAGMGTTVISALVGDDGAIAFGHVGDSRAYLLRDGELRRLTDDHSLVGELVRQGELTEAEAEHHPQRSVITRALGAEPNVQVDTFTVDSAARRHRAAVQRRAHHDGRRARSSSDSWPTPRAAPRRPPSWSRAALAAGGEDNVTVIVFRIDDLPDLEDDEPTPGEHVLPPDVWHGGASADETEEAEPRAAATP